MATIQIREIPEAAYEVLRRRARRRGQSIQAYMRDQVVAITERPTKDEALAVIESVLDRLGEGASPGALADDVAADRR